MAQPQLDLPPISFARYLDLLKRRRWQVLPISIAGLVIGAVVAFLIPRYYVARTIVQFRGNVLGVDSNARGDPMEALLGSAEITLRWRALPRALAELGWPEARSGTPDQQRAFEEDVRSRISIADVGAKGQGRQTADLAIVYKDTDGQRAMALTNTLRDVWLEEERAKLEAEWKAALAAIREDVRLAQRNEEYAMKELRHFEEEHAINPQDWVGDRADGGLSPLSKERSTVYKRIQDLEIELEKDRAQLEKKQEKLATTDATISEEVEARIGEDLQKIFDRLQGEVIVSQAALQNIHPHHPQHPLFAHRLEQATKQLAELKKTFNLEESKEVPNPAYTALLEDVDGLEDAIASNEAEVAQLRDVLAGLETKIEELPEIGQDYRDLQRKLTDAQGRFDDLQERAREIELRRDQLMRSRAYEVLDHANVPPRPTEPNITLVALAGSAVGLAVAIGLILLIDILQSTFKTVQDVEHVLPVPVLGGISHMETLEHRRSVHQRRTRAGVVAGVFLLLTVSVITIYYVWPSRLPPVVRTTLDMILGEPQTDSVK